MNCTSETRIQFSNQCSQNVILIVFFFYLEKFLITLQALYRHGAAAAAVVAAGAVRAGKVVVFVVPTGLKLINRLPFDPAFC